MPKYIWLWKYIYAWTFPGYLSALYNLITHSTSVLKMIDLNCKLCAAHFWSRFFSASVRNQRYSVSLYSNSSLQNVNIYCTHFWRTLDMRHVSAWNLSRNRPWRPSGMWDVEAPTFSKQSANRSRWGCELYAPAFLPPKKIPGTHFCQRLSRPQGHSTAGRISSGIEPVTFRLVA
jgi:hypothetical protein